MPPAEQGESAADRTFDAVKDVADTPRSAAAHSKEAATVSARGAVKRVGTKKGALNGRHSGGGRVRLSCLSGFCACDKDQSEISQAGVACIAERFLCLSPP